MTRDHSSTVATSLTFSFALAVAHVIVPLVGLAAGYSPAELGLYIALSALAQMAVRLGLVAAMRHLSDRSLIAAAIVLLAVSSALVVVSTAVVPFVGAQLLQGAARACYWTASQTHAVRTHSDATRAIAALNLASSVGMMLGPLAAGLVAEWSLQAALMVSAVTAAASLPLVPFLDRLPLLGLERRAAPGSLWRRPGVHVACWASASTGAWRGMLGSYVPIVLQSAQHSPTTVGVLVSVANVAVLVGSGILVRGAYAATRTGLALAIVGSGLGIAAVGVTAQQPVLAGLALALSGLGAGVLQTLGPVMATAAVAPDESGRAIVATGTFRAGALFVSPLGVAGALTVAGITSATGLALVGLLIALPVLTLRRSGV